MSQDANHGQVSLAAKNPFELRVSLGEGVRGKDVRAALASGDMGFLHSFTAGSALDGPGIRVVAWMSGCMWRCLYCHNPDTWTMRNGIPVTIARATDELKKYGHGRAAMPGGFTLSGGELLMQHRFAVKFLRAAHAMGIHTALDTNGYFGGRITDSELESVDLVLLDLKAWNPERHERLTGMEIGPTLDFARRLAYLKKPVWVRFVVVPGWSDDEATVAGIAGFAALLGNVQRVDVLPFHQMGRSKWAQLGLKYELTDIEPPSQDTVERICTVFRSRGLRAN